MSSQGKPSTNRLDESGNVPSGAISKPDTKGTEGKSIIVVGDWFVDEHWVTGVHRSSSASRAGQSHHRAIQDLTSAIEAFCGAGRTASLLHQVRKDERQAFSIYGIGIWHEEDKNALKSMFEFENLIGQTHHRLSRKKMLLPSGVYLYNLGHIIKDAGTTRIVRMYQTTSDQHIQFSRVDWELEGRYDERYGPPMRKLDPKKVAKFLDSITTEEQKDDLLFRDSRRLPEARETQAVVLKDLRRGVISKGLVEWFAKRYKDVPWFVSTKDWNPEWLSLLKKVNLRVLLIPQVAAREAAEVNEFGCWITRAAYPEQEAMQTIDELVKRTINDSPTEWDNTYHPRIIVLPDKFKVLAYDPSLSVTESDRPESTEMDALVQKDVSIGPLDVEMGMASVFLPVLVAILNKSPSMNLKELIEKALKHTYRWVRYEGQRVTHPKRWNGTKVSFLSDPEPGTDSPSVSTKKFSWKEEQKRWESAMKDTGVIEIKKRHEFQLWRSMTEIDGYACCVREEKKTICKLMRGIKAFSRSGRNHHVCCMLVASPGSGKTFFVRQLAKTLEFHFLPFNITQMVFRSDILDCFDTIVTTQAQEPDRPLLVFVDEINSKLEGDLVYNAFLTPIEDGLYMRGGKVFHIAPCVWVFSGTEVPASPDDHDRGRSLKGSDFKSRLTLGVVKIERNESHLRVQTENVYRAVAMIRGEFPDVRYVSEGVLKLFLCLEENISVRQMKNLVKSFVNIQYGKILTTNVPTEALKTLQNNKAFDMQSWTIKKNAVGEGFDVDIISI